MVKNSNVINFKKTPYIIAEIGINHNGYLKLAKKMIYESKKAGADAVKFQKRNANDLVNSLDKLGKSTGYLSKNENDINHKSKKFGTWVYPDLRLELSDKDYKELKK
jgi:sialic acid synthase SpsE